MKKRVFLTVIIFVICTFAAFSQSTTSTSPQPYNDDEFPLLMKDLRRFEVITLGAMPFVTLDAAIIYNGYKYVAGKTTTFNPLATADYKPDEMKKIIITSLCVSAGIGITDFVVRIVKRNASQKKEKQEMQGIRIEEDPDAIKLPLPQKYTPDEETD